LAAVGVHGLWNTMAIFIVLLPIITKTGAQTTMMQTLAGVGSSLIAGLLLLIAAALVLINRHLRQETLSAPMGVIPPPSI
jgi:hypothetical protein